MSLAVLADHMASKGRNGDTMLVHMAPEEVAGLHALALAHGEKLTINPETGLPEAFSLKSLLKSLLPAIAGFALAPLTAGTSLAFLGATPLASALTVGGITGLAKGSLKEGILAGLGAYGGASLGAGLTGAGVGAAQDAAVSGLTEGQIAGRMAESAGTLTQQGVMNEAAAEAAKQYAAQPMSAQLASGFQAAAQDPLAFAKANVKPLMYTAAPVMADMMVPTNVQMPGLFAQRPPMIQDYGYTPLGGYEFLGARRAASGGLMGSSGIVALARGGDAYRTYREDTALDELPIDQSFYQPSGPADVQQDIIASPQITALPFVAAPAVVPAAPAPAPAVVPAAPAAPAAASVVPTAPAVISTAPAATTATAPSGLAALASSTKPFATGADVLPSYLGINAVAASGAPSSIISSTAGAGYDYAAAAPRDAIETAVNDIYNRVLGRQAEQSGLDYWANAVRNKTLSLAEVEGRIRQIGQDIGVNVDPTQLATPTAVQLGAQRSILADPQSAALGLVRSGVAQGLSDQQIANLANETYGKSFSAQNVADFMRANNIVRPAPPPPPPPPSPSTDLPAAPVISDPRVTLGDAFQPTAPTMSEVKSAYEQGGGSTKMPVITDIKPTDRTYTQNQTFALLEGYLKSNPNALYSDVVAFARSKGIPEMQARAAYNEFRFSDMPGGSKAAYDYLMGRGAYPVKPFTPTGELMRPYAEAVLGMPENIQTKQFLFDPATQKYVRNPAYVPRTSSATLAAKNPRDQAGNLLTGNSATYFAANPDVYQRWQRGDTGMTADAYAKFHWETFGQKEGRKGWTDTSTGGGKTGDTDTGTGGNKAGGLMDIASAAARGGNIQQYNLGGYSDGGRLLRGPGDGVSDSIPATIGNRQPARLADGEFVVPARIVSEIGNGSTEAGARKLYAMMDRVQRARAKTTGKGKVAKNTRAEKYLPA